MRVLRQVNQKYAYLITGFSMDKSMDDVIDSIAVDWTENDCCFSTNNSVLSLILNGIFRLVLIQ